MLEAPDGTHICQGPKKHRQELSIDILASLVRHGAEMNLVLGSDEVYRKFLELAKTFCSEIGENRNETDAQPNHLPFHAVLC